MLLMVVLFYFIYENDVSFQVFCFPFTPLTKFCFHVYSVNVYIFNTCLCAYFQSCLFFLIHVLS